MPYILTYNTEREMLWEHRTAADGDRIMRTANAAGQVAMPISGCEARAYIREGRPHNTSFELKSDGRVVRKDV